MFDDINKSIKANMYERATSPLFGAFLLSWAIWNYETILVLFSSINVSEKITYIKTNIYVYDWPLLNDWALLCKGALFPLLSSLVFILIYPHPAKWIYIYWHNEQQKLKTIKQSIEKDALLTLGESRQIRRELLRLESAYEEEITKKKNEIDRLKDIINRFENQDTETERTESRPPTELKESQPISEFQVILLKEIAESGGTLFDYDSKILGKIGKGKVESEYYLEDLAEKGYIQRNYNDGDGDGSYVNDLSFKGKRYIVENKLGS